MLVSWCELLCDLMFTKLTWLRSPFRCDTFADSTRPRAIRLAMLTMKKETLGFNDFYSCFSSLSPISIGMRLRSPALRADEAPL